MQTVCIYGFRPALNRPDGFAVEFGDFLHTNPPREQEDDMKTVEIASLGPFTDLLLDLGGDKLRILDFNGF